jgi:hypothetical protein
MLVSDSPRRVPLQNTIIGIKTSTNALEELVMKETKSVLYLFFEIPGFPPHHTNVYHAGMYFDYL